MERVLLITTRNILSTSGELRLIKNRAVVMLREWAIHTDFIVLRNKNKISKSENIETGNTDVYALNVLNPIGTFKIIKKFKDDIKEKIVNGQYGTVVLSGVGTLLLYYFIRSNNKSIKIIADIHGSNVDMIEFARFKNIRKKIYFNFIYIFEEILQKHILKKVDSLFVVSEALKDYVSNRYALNNNQKFYIVPCAVERTKIDTKHIEEFRSQSRTRYGIKEDEILFVYSGGVSSWQCIETSINIFNQIVDTGKISCKMLILSHQIDQIIPLVEDNKLIITDCLKAEEVFPVLCSGDFAFLMREDLDTNHVAFPNKFLEYVQAGLKIISTPYIYDVAEYIKQYRVGTIIDLDQPNINNLIDYVQDNSDNRNLSNHLALLKKTSFDETLKLFAKDFIK